VLSRTSPRLTATPRSTVPDATCLAPPRTPSTLYPTHFRDRLLDHPKNRAAIFGDPGPSPLEGFFQDTLLEGLGRAWGASAEVHPATLLNRPPPRSPRSPARDPSWASEITSRTPRNPRPELGGLAGPHVEPQDFPGPVLTYPNGYHRRSTVPPGRRSAPAPPSRPATHTDTPPPRADSKPLHRCRSGRPRSGCSPPAPGLGPGRLPSGCSPPLRDASCTTLTSARSARRRGSSRLGK
jgi:hypothetical protein